MATLNHPSYVYSAKIHPKRKGNNFLIIATACFDAKIRFWYVNTDLSRYVQNKCELSLIISTQDTTIYDGFSSLLEHRHPNSLCFDINSRMFVGDSLGCIHKFDVPNIT